MYLDKDIFKRNLLWTQQYCERQLENTDRNYASILRSINPDNKGQKMFVFSPYQVAGQMSSYAVKTTWQSDPIDTPNLIGELFKTQIEIKQEQTIEKGLPGIYKGDILVFKVDETCGDGAACIASLGLLDDFNCPPIDTWFYLTREGNSRVLFAWIPFQFVNDVNDGIAVNPENCIDWFKAWYPAQFSTVI